MRLRVLITAIIVTAFCVEGFATEPNAKLARKERRAKEQTEYEKQVAQAIHNRDYTIDVTRVTPNQGRSFSVAPYYSLQIKGDSVYSALPYFGRAYSAPYGGGEGLRFDAVTTNFKSSDGRKGTLRSEFDVRSSDDSYRYMIEVFPNGQSSIYVMPNNKQSITFSGNVVFKKDKKK